MLFWKVLKLLSLQAMDEIIIQTFFYKDRLGIKLSAMVDMPLKYRNQPLYLSE